MLDEMDNLAEIIHSASCSGNTPCPLWKKGSRHQNYYRQAAESIMKRLEPVIGAANVPTAVRVILSEMA
jgi:hypothetical protein